MLKPALLLVALLSLAASIQIPLQQGHFQCMIIYSSGHDETIKIDISFPRISNWTSKDKYQVTLRNTKTNKIQSEELEYGHFRREVVLYERIIYEVCFQFLSPRQVDEEILVDYDADTHYMVDTNTLNLPQNLLKAQNMKQTYQKALALKNLTSNLLKLQKQRTQLQQKQFLQTQNTQNKIVIISVIEIMLILAAGVYQFCQFRDKLYKEYISL